MKSAGLVAVRAFAATVGAVGAVGLWLAYSGVPRFLPEYVPGVVWTGVLLVAGVMMVATASARTRRARWLWSVAVLAAGGAVGGAVYSGVAARLWIQVVVQFG